MSISNYAEDQLLDAVFNADPFSVTTVAVQLHIGEPGEAGTANVATETGREVATFGGSSGGQVQSDADVTWTSVAASEDYTDISLWDNATPAAGNCLWTGPLGPGTMAPSTAAVSDTFTSPAHGFANDDRVRMRAFDGAILPTGVDGTTLYFIIAAATDTFQVSLTSGGAAVNITVAGEAIVQIVVPAPVLIGQNFILPAGQIVATLD